MRTLVWYRGKDLRLHDHAPLRDAAKAGQAIPLFVLEDRFFAGQRARELPHRIQFLVDALSALSRDLSAAGSRLVIVEGDSRALVPRLARTWRVDRVVAHRAVEPRSRARDRAVAAALSVPFVLYEGETLLPPGTVRTRAGTPFSVFTPFARAFAEQAQIAGPFAAPRSLPRLPRGLDLRTEVKIPRVEQLGIERNPHVLAGGERAARDRLRRFLSGPAHEYDTLRDRIDVAGTSRLSVDLKYGTLSARAIYTKVARALPDGDAKRAFLNELVWREFTYSTLWDRPELLHEPFRRGFARFPWSRNASSRAFWAWKEGRTGYPIIDAAARQLLLEGFMHNRARMITASFLTKHLLIHYQLGEAHFMKYLTDGDPAQNNFNWQWSAGCGCDAQPYFRVFNPITQGEKFDPDGAYVRRYVPELADVPTRYIHSPFRAPHEVLRAASVQLGKTYPRPIVSHAEARQRFLMLAAEALPRR